MIFIFHYLMDTTKRSLFFAALSGFLVGCAVVWIVWPRGEPGTTIPMLDSPIAANQTQPQIQIAGKPQETGAQDTQDTQATQATQDARAQPAPRGAEARRILDEIKRDKAAAASVNVRFFAARNGKLSQQFIDFFELAPAETGALSDLIQATRTEMWKAANAQAQVSRTATGGVVVKIPPATAGPDIYDKVMNGFQSVLGDDRFNDMMLYDGGQIDTLFNQFGGEERVLTIEPGNDGRYNISISHTEPGGGSTSQNIGGQTLDNIKQYWPEYEEFLPGK